MAGDGLPASVGSTVTSSEIVDATIVAADLADGAVTLAKMADLAQDLFIGRTTGSTGVPETATITAAARTVLDDTTVGAMVDTLGGATTTGTGGIARATSPTFVTPALGTPASGTLTNCTGLPTVGLAGWEASNGCKLTFGVVNEEVTIAAAAFTDSTATMAAGDFVFGPFVRVTTLIPTAATFAVGVAGATTKYGNGLAVAAGTTNTIPVTAAAFGTHWIITANALAVRITPDVQPADNSGRVRVVWFYIRPTAPTS